ncbi:MAG: Ig-like domain-containing protein, partial [Bacteroidia bacterium]|nr:Ig-like domain-containing protein [Bacteroidia bacterium]
MKKYLVSALCIIAVFFYSCEKDANVTGVTLDKATLALCVNGTGQLVATIEPSDVYGRIKWSSSDSTVASVVDGVITGVSVGTAQIVATVGSYTATCDVTISAAVTSITLNKTSVRLKVDSIQLLMPTLLPVQPEAVVGAISWTSTNPLVATVTSNGKITAVSLGTATIVASIGTVTATCTVSVFNTTPSSLMGTNYYLI